MKINYWAVVAAAALYVAPACAKPYSAQVVSPAVEQAMKMILESPSNRSTRELIDPQEKPVAPVKCKSRPHKELDRVLILGGPESLPM